MERTFKNHNNIAIYMLKMSICTKCSLFLKYLSCIYEARIFYVPIWAPPIFPKYTRQYIDWALVYMEDFGLCGQQRSLCLHFRNQSFLCILLFSTNYFPHLTSRSKFCELHTTTLQSKYRLFPNGSIGCSSHK